RVSSSSFFFYLSLFHLDLHSFPTRRSSDLSSTSLITNNKSIPNHNRKTRILLPGNDNIFMSKVEWCRDRKFLGVIAVGFSNGILDRKSTRLNSSHVKISYAVFCLKKKKNNE